MTDLAPLHARQRIRIDELEEEVRQLKEALVPTCSFERLHLTQQETRILSCILARSPQHISPQRIERAIWDDEMDEHCPSILRVVIYKIRAKLRPLGLSIKSRNSSGYWITEADGLVMKGMLD